MNKQHGKRATMTSKRRKTKIHVDSLRTILKKVLNWKMPGHDGIYGYWF